MTTFLLALGFVGLGMIVQLATSNIVLQTIVDDDKRGRVMSLYTMAVMGMTPFGSILGGALAHHLGVPTTFLLGGVVCLGGALLFAVGAFGSARSRARSRERKSQSPARCTDRRDESAHAVQRAQHDRVAHSFKS